MNALGRNQFCRNETARTMFLTINVTFAVIAGATVSHGFYVQSKGLINIVWPHFELRPLFCHIIAIYYQQGFLFIYLFIFCQEQLVAGEFPQVVAAIQIESLKDTITFSHLLIRVRLGLCAVATIYLWLAQIDPLPQCSSLLSLYTLAESLD